MTATPLLAVDRLSVSIGDSQIIRQLSFRVDAGEIVGLAGASGSGKSMTALAIMRLLPPRARSSGAVYLNGAAITSKSEAELEGMRGRDIGMVFQEPMTALNPLMKIGDQVAETVLLHGAAGEEAMNVGDVLEFVRALKACKAVTQLCCERKEVQTEEVESDAARWSEHTKIMKAATMPGALLMRFMMNAGGKQWGIEYVLDTERLGHNTLGVKAVGLAAEQKAIELFDAINKTPAAERKP